jgi:hypothetical protein
VNGFIDHLYTPSELHVITALLPISTIHRSPQHQLSLFPACCVFNSGSLATASNSEDSSAFRDHVVTVWRISDNWTLVHRQLNYSAIFSRPPLQNSSQLPTHNWTLSLTNQIFHFTSLHSTELSCQVQVKLQITLRLTVGQSVGLMIRYLLLFDSHGLVFVERPLWLEDGSVFCQSHCVQ